MHEHHGKSLLQQTGTAGWAWLFVLLITFCVQALALFVPFMAIEEIMHGNMIYSLPNSVRLMWENQLYVVSILIAFFSITFPFLKLAALLITWVAVEPTRKRRSILTWLCLLGKWSMLDPFIVILLLVLATNQWAVKTQTYAGVYLFLGGIASAIVLSTIALQLDRKYNPESGKSVSPSQVKTVLLKNSGWLSYVGPGMLVIAAICFGVAIRVPFFRLDQDFLESNSYSIWQSAMALVQNKQPELAALIFISLILAPSITLVLQCWLWISPATAAKHQHRNNRLRGLHEWCMLEVFALALILFVWEGRSLMNTDIKPGLWIIMITIVIYYLGSYISLRALERITKQTPS